MNVQLVFRAAMAVIQKKRNKEQTWYWMIAIIFIPFFIVMLCMGVLIYLITTPLSLLEGILGEDSGIRDFKLHPTILNYSASGNYDAITYKDYSIEHNGKVITYYNQLDKPWKDMLYGNLASIGNSGCGPTSMAMIISTLLNIEVTPAEMADWSYENGYLVQYYTENELYASTSHSFIPGVAAAYDLSCTGIAKNNDTKQKIVNALVEGNYLVAIMGPGHFTSGGHFIILSGITKEGNIKVVDSASRTRTNQEWNIDLIIDEARTYAGAGGPFWIITTDKD